MKKKQSEKFDLDKVNLAELERRIGIIRAKLRRLKSIGFVDHPHALIRYCVYAQRKQLPCDTIK